MYTFQLLGEIFLLQLLRPGFLFMSQLTFNLKVNNLNFHNWNFCLAVEGLEGCTHPGHLTTSSSGALIRASVGGCRLPLSIPLSCLPLPSLQATPPRPHHVPCKLQPPQPLQMPPAGTVCQGHWGEWRKPAQAPVGISFSSSSFQNCYQGENICLFFLSTGNAEGTFQSVPGRPGG